MDRFFRRLNLGEKSTQELSKLSQEESRMLHAYVGGINARRSQKTPWELKLVGYRPEPWTAEDTVLLTRAVGYVGQAQTQGTLERLFVEMVQAGVSDDVLLKLFPNIPEVHRLHGDDPRDSTRDLLSRVRLGRRIVPERLSWSCAVASPKASNSWVVSGARTKSKRPLLANDPHVEISRLPNTWYEVTATVGGLDHYVLSAGIPGIPAPLLGRTKTLSWGATYSFMDAIDSWVEDCREGKYRVGDEWHAFSVRSEVIKRKSAPSERVHFFENRHGVLDGDPHEPGLLLATRWTSASTGARSLQSALAMWTVTDLDRGMTLLGNIDTAWNWVLADSQGNIGYQMSGIMPRRRPAVSGFVPLPGWHSDNDWQGRIPPEDLPRHKNPDVGFFVTANQDLNRWGVASPQNATVADYRADRISALLRERFDLTVEDCAAIQYDVLSLQAERFMDLLRPLLPDTEAGRLLQRWDCRYSAGSEPAMLFERFYATLMELVFGQLLGRDVIRHLVEHTEVIIAFFNNFDRLLLDPHLFEGGSQVLARLYLEAFNEAAAVPSHERRPPTATLRHLLFRGRLPQWMGFDRGPIALTGGRATPLQVQTFNGACVGPAIRLIADMAEDTLYTNLIGGPSDRRFSKWYDSDTANWIAGRFKVLTVEASMSCRQLYEC